MARQNEERGRRRSANDIAIAVCAGVLAGVSGALLAGRFIDLNVVGAWGALYGTLAFFIAFGGTLALRGRREQRRAGSLVVALATGLLSSGSWLWILGWDIPPLTLEGAWLWPLAVASSIVAMVAIVRTVKPGR